ncbi:fimbrial protein [Burkholderia ubonensis]|nr:fimbrial protein [Burkholderia ubonensis]
MKKNIVQWMLMGLLLVLAQKSYALSCLKNGTEARDSIALSTTIGVLNTLPKDTVLWRSQNYSINVSCFVDSSVGEFVYFYLSPDDRDLTKLGPDVELGVNLDGQDRRCTQLDRCRVQLPYYIDKCNQIGGCNNKAISFTLNFNFFVSKRSAPSAGKEGSLNAPQIYAAFQLDGAGGMNSAATKNFRMIVNGLNQLRYVACASTLGISPNTIDFGRIATAGAQSNGLIKEVPFRVTSNKTCNSVYGLGAKLTPVGGTLTGDILVPDNNKSVGISLLKQEDRSTVPFGKEFLLVESSGDRVAVKNFLAQLKWNGGQPVLGRFSAGATVDIYYK